MAGDEVVSVRKRRSVPETRAVFTLEATMVSMIVSQSRWQKMQQNMLDRGVSVTFIPKVKRRRGDRFELTWPTEQERTIFLLKYS